MDLGFMERPAEPEGPDPAYERFEADILELTGVSLRSYKEKQMKRRINTLMERKGFSGYEDYVRALRDDSGERAFFLDYITINVTEFFRTPDHWTCFEENVLPELIGRKGSRLKIWCCACATGEEPYSLVMSLADRLPLSEIRVTATDIDRKVLEQAAKGLFSEKSVENVPAARREKYFTPVKGGWQISREVIDCVEFRHMDILKEEFPKEQDLILCRNVLIYFTEDAKNEIYRKFHDSLAEGGYLFTGNTEQIIQYKSFGYLKEKNFLYRRQTAAAENTSGRLMR